MTQTPPDRTPAARLVDELARDFAPAERTVPAMLARQAERFGGKPLVSSGGQSWTYAQALAEAGRFGATLRAAGIERAGALVAALADDAANLFVTLSGRTLNPDLFIVARARQEDSIHKLARAGADRVVNPQSLGAARMASFVVRPHVAEFVDVVMHERSMEFRMQEVVVPATSCFAGRTLRELDLRQRAGVLVLAVRDSTGAFRSNPDPDTVIAPGDVVIAVGTETGLQRLCELAEDR